ncbi:hypothetical protein [uncultured Clostridium sp.]|uniref:hypothetical protein n=1 Tax=uncultured Clostridium sp. TaxID=59620 RepID=UPI00280C0110|nr:hypothetical protein [uncultured Clostridium sp.]
MTKKKTFFLIIFSLVIVIFIVFKSFDSKNIDIKKEPDNLSFVDVSESKFFNYDYYVKINSNKETPEYISIIFTMDIEPKVDGKFENVIATAFINKEVQKSMAVDSYYTFGVSETEPLSIDRNNSEKKGFSIARGTWLYKDTDIDKLITDLRLGIDVEVTWDGGKEYVHINDVKIENYE